MKFHCKNKTDLDKDKRDTNYKIQYKDIQWCNVVTPHGNLKPAGKAGRACRQSFLGIMILVTESSNRIT